AQYLSNQLLPHVRRVERLRQAFYRRTGVSLGLAYPPLGGPGRLPEMEALLQQVVNLAAHYPAADWPESPAWRAGRRLMLESQMKRLHSDRGWSDGHEPIPLEELDAATLLDRVWSLHRLIEAGEQAHCQEDRRLLDQGWNFRRVLQCDFVDLLREGLAKG